MGQGAEDEAVLRGAQEGAAGEEHRRLRRRPGERGAAADEERQLAGDDHQRFTIS